MAARIVDKEAKRQEIYTKAMKLFASQGIAETTISQIAKAAGIGKGTVYEYFESKEEIIFSAFVHILGEFEVHMENSFVPCDDPIETIRSFILSMTDYYKYADNDTMILLIMFQVNSTMNDSQKFKDYLFRIKDIKTKSFQQFYPPLIEAIQTALEQKIIRPVNPTDLLSSIIYYITGSAMVSIFSKKVETSPFDGIANEPVATTFIDILLNGLLTNNHDGGKS